MVHVDTVSAYYNKIIILDHYIKSFTVIVSGTSVHMRSVMRQVLASAQQYSIYVACADPGTDTHEQDI